MTTNVMGTFSMLQAALNITVPWRGGEEGAFPLPPHFHGRSIRLPWGRTACLRNPRRTAPIPPSSASKASSDHLVRAWHDTYGLPVLITNCSNNYGPYQFPEKLIPVVVLKALGGEPHPRVRQGGNVRDWLYVEDHCEALLTVVSSGKPGETYNIGGNNEKTNLELVSCCAPIWMNCGPARTAGATGSRSPLCRTGPATTCAMRLMRPKYGGSWAGLRARTIPPGSGKPFSGIWIMRTGGGESCPGNTVWNVWEPMARKLI